MTKTIKKTISLALLSVTLLGTAGPVLADEKTDVQNQITTINQELTDTTTKISELLGKIGDNEATIKDNETKIKSIRETLNSQARAMQTDSESTNLFTLLLQAKSLSDIFDIFNSSSTIASANDENITKMNALIKENKAKQESLTKELNDLQKSQQDLEQSNTDLQSKLQSINDAEAKAKAEQQVKANVQNAKSVATVVAQTTNGGNLPSQASGTKQFAPSQAREAFEQITQDYGVTGYEKQIWEQIITAESGWNTTVWNGGGSGAYGLGQALPADKMAVYGSDYMTNPYTQLVWMYNYVRERYGSFAGVQWESRGWY